MSREIERYRTRLLNVAKALRESPVPKAFDMNFYVYGDEWATDSISKNYNKFDCGTPACALGHYASRPDLQSTLKVLVDEDGQFASFCDKEFTNVTYDNDYVMLHFGVNEKEAQSLFSGDGCGNAKTAKGAAKFIENFVKNRTDEDFRKAVKEVKEVWGG